MSQPAICYGGYSVPWRLIGEQVWVTVTGSELRIAHGGREVAQHPRSLGRRSRVIDPAHFAGVAGAAGQLVRTASAGAATTASPPPALLRPLAEYEAVVGEGWS